MTEETWKSSTSAAPVDNANKSKSQMAKVQQPHIRGNSRKLVTMPFLEAKL